MRRVELRYTSEEAMVADHEKNLSKGRALVSGVDEVSEREACELVVYRPDGATFVLPGEAVWSSPIGVGLALTDFGPAKKLELQAFVSGASRVVDPLPEVETASPEVETAEIATETSEEVASADGAAPDSDSVGAGPTDEPVAPDAVAEDAEVAGGEAAEAIGGGAEAVGVQGDAAHVDPPPSDGAEPGSSRHRNIHERVRSLSVRERDEMARRGALPERVALERAFGATVWEGLLQNPQITMPEVARIAANGALPKPLVNVILASGAWVAAAEVQRALLSNPRCSGPHLERVLRAMRPKDVQRLAQQCPYRGEVRSAAQRLSKR